MTDEPQYFDSVGNLIDPDGLGEPLTEEQATAMFDQRLASWRDMVRGFAEPVEGEPLPLLCSDNLPIANDALRMYPDDVHEFASLGILFAADHLRVHGDEPLLVLEP